MAEMTIVNLFEQLYDAAIVPETMESLIGTRHFERLMRWQRAHPIEDGPRVLTVDKLPDESDTTLYAFQSFALFSAMKTPGFREEEETNTSDEDEDPPIPPPHEIFFRTAEDYVEWDIGVKMDYYEQTGKRKRKTDPPLSWFPSAEVKESALRQCMLVCTDATHVGDRRLRPDQVYKDINRKCKECTLRKKRKPLASYASADEWAARFPTSNPQPKAAEFADAAAYEAACALHEVRSKEYKKAHNDANKDRRKAARQGLPH